METKFTKGEWKIENNLSGLETTIYCGKKRIAEFKHYKSFKNDPSFEEGKANAKLAESAPDMFSAIVEFCDRVDRGEVRSTKTYNQFKEIIKKATL